jgi:hypothetical protein
MSKPLVRRSALASVACLLLLGFGSGRGQPKEDELPRVASPDLNLPRVPPTVTPPAPPTVDDLINQLEKVRKQKEELDKQERAITEQLKERLKHQGDRLSKLGVVLTPPAPPSPPDVPTIFIGPEPLKGGPYKEIRLPAPK